MFICKICDLNIQINNRYNLIEKLSKDYITKKPEHIDIILEAGEAEIDEEIKKYPQYSREYSEGLVLFRKLCVLVIPFGIFFLHSAAVAYKGNGYIFTGKSGTGKSTHAALWTEVFPEAFVINGDKPLIRLLDDKFYVYGTPWAGKEAMQKNTSCKICGVCFLEQAKENSIQRLTSRQVISKIFNQTVYIKEANYNEMLMKLLDKFIKDIPFFLLKCTVSHDAVLTAYNAMSKEV